MPEETQGRLPPTEELNKAQPGQKMSADEHAAALGFMTTLSQQMMGQPEEGQNSEGKDTQTSQVNPPEQPNKEVESIKEDFAGFKEQITSVIKDELGGIKEMVQNALKEDEPKKD